MSKINTGDLYTIKTKGFASSHVLNRNFESISESHNELEGRMRNIETGEPVSDAEIQIARGTYATLNERLSATGKTMRENIVIQGMQAIELTYPSDGRVSFTIKKGEVLIEGEIVKVAQDTVFTNVDIGQNYGVVVCDASGVISVMTQVIPVVGQNKRPLYLLKNQTSRSPIFYDCRRWGVMSLMGWHFSLQEAFDDFIVNYFEELHSLRHQHLSLEYVGVANRLETREEIFPTLRSDSTMTKSAIATQLKQWTLHVKGRERAVFLIEDGQGYKTVLETNAFKQSLFENFSIKIGPLGLTNNSIPFFIVNNYIFKDCQLDYATNNDSSVSIEGLIHLTGTVVKYINTDMKVPSSYFKDTHFQKHMDKCQADSLSINGHLLTSESLNLVKDTSSTATYAKKYMLFQYEIPNFIFYRNHVRESILIEAGYDRRRLISSDFVLQSAIMSGPGITDDVDISALGFFVFSNDDNYYFNIFEHVTPHLPTYNDVSVKLTFKVYTWYLFLADYSSPSS